MCDNCKTGLSAGQKDVTEEAKRVSNIVEHLDERKCQMTIPQFMDLLKGRKVKSACAKPEITDQFKGALKFMSDADIRRLLLAMLTKKILKENFVQMKVGPQTIIMVYLLQGRNGANFANGRGQINQLFLSEGVDKRDKFEYSMNVDEPDDAADTRKRTNANVNNGGYQKLSKVNDVSK